MKYLFLIFSLVSFYSTAQILKGTVVDSLGNPVFNATLSIRKPSNDEILYYTLSDINGDFQFTQLDFSGGLLELKARHFSYKEETLIVNKSSKDLKVFLSERVNKLKEVLIKEPDIAYRRDTLSYSVSAFKDINDRSIADVIKNMPGLTVSKNGIIQYQGRSIENFYIEGLNLLEGKYNLASSSINANDVSKVEVLENHEPKVILDSISNTTRTSLNIKLKKNTVTSGLGEVGTGFEPLLYQIKATPLFFKAKQQHILSYQGNNTSEDLENQIKDLSLEATLRTILEGGTGGSFFLSDLARFPSIPTAFVRDNDDHLFTANSLFVLKKDLQIKYKISYLKQDTDQFNQLTNALFRPQDTVLFNESNRITEQRNLLNADIVIENNSKVLYLKNFSTFNYLDQEFNSALNNSNLGLLDSRTSQRSLQFKNKFESILKIRNLFLNLTNNFEYRSLKESGETVNDSDSQVIEDVFPVFQNVNREQFIFSLGGDVKKSFGKFVADFALQSRLEKNKVMSLGQRGSDGIDINDYEFWSIRNGLTSGLRYDTRIFQIEFNSPLYLRSFELNNEFSGLLGTSNYLLFEPRLDLTLRFSDKLTTTLTSGIDNSFNDYSSLFVNPINTSFRSVVSNIPRINRTSTLSNSLFLRFKNILRNYFFNFSASYDNSKSDLTPILTINEDGSRLSNFIARPNQTRQFSASGNFDKVIPSLNLTSKTNFSGSINNSDSFINDELTRVSSSSFQVGQQFITEITEQILLDNKVSYSATTSDLFSTTLTSNRLSISNELAIDLAEDLQIRGEYEYLAFTGDLGNFNVNFLNLGLEKKFKKGRSLLFTVNNLFNLDTFEQTSVSLNTTSNISHRLRPRQFLISYLFSF